MTAERKMEPDDCINALRAMMTFTERSRDENAEPVTFQGNEIDGYAIIFQAGIKLGMFAQGLEFASIVSFFAQFLMRQKAAMPPDMYRKVTLPLLITLADDLVKFMAEEAPQ